MSKPGGLTHEQVLENITKKHGSPTPTVYFTCTVLKACLSKEACARNRKLAKSHQVCYKCKLKPVDTEQVSVEEMNSRVQHVDMKAHLERQRSIEEGRKIRSNSK